MEKTDSVYKASGICPKCHLPYVYIGDPVDGFGPKPYCTCKEEKPVEQPTIDTKVNVIFESFGSDDSDIKPADGILFDFLSGWQHASEEGFADKPDRYQVKALYMFYKWLMKHCTVTRKG